MSTEGTHRSQHREVVRTTDPRSGLKRPGIGGPLISPRDEQMPDSRTAGRPPDPPDARDRAVRMVSGRRGSTGSRVGRGRPGTHRRAVSREPRGPVPGGRRRSMRRSIAPDQVQRYVRNSIREDTHRPCRVSPRAGGPVSHRMHHRCALVFVAPPPPSTFRIDAYATRWTTSWAAQPGRTRQTACRALTAGEAMFCSYRRAIRSPERSTCAFRRRCARFSSWDSMAERMSPCSTAFARRCR